LLQRKGVAFNLASQSKLGVLGYREFVAPEKTYSPPLEATAAQGAEANGANFSNLVLFDGTDKHGNVSVYSPAWETDPYAFVWSDRDEGALNLTHKPSGKGQKGGFQVYVSTLVADVNAKMPDYKVISIAVEGRKQTPAKVVLVDQHANAVSAAITINSGGGALTVSLNSFAPGNFMLLPRPYPGFQPLYFEPTERAFDIRKLEKIQVLLEGDDQENEVRVRRIELLN